MEVQFNLVVAGSATSPVTSLGSGDVFEIQKNLFKKYLEQFSAEDNYEALPEEDKEHVLKIFAETIRQNVEDISKDEFDIEEWKKDLLNHCRSVCKKEKIDGYTIARNMLHFRKRIDLFWKISGDEAKRLRDLER